MNNYDLNAFRKAAPEKKYFCYPQIEILFLKMCLFWIPHTLCLFLYCLYNLLANLDSQAMLFHNCNFVLRPINSTKTYTEFASLIN